MWLSWFQGVTGVIHWETIQETKAIETSIHTFRLGPFELTVPANVHVVFEYFQGSELNHNSIASYVFLFLILFFAAVLVSVFSTLRGFWYFGSMAAFILFIVGLRLEMLLLFGLRSVIVPAVVIFIFAAISYYFKSIRPDIPFTIRLIVFLSVMVALVLAIVFFAESAFPLLYLAMAAYGPGLILSILFMIIIGHEIIASFVYIAGQGKSRTLTHFMIITAIYLFNVIITCLYEINAIEWDFVYINVYLLLTASAILGLWGFRNRESLFGNVFSFAPYGGYYFLALGGICFATTGELLGNANDAALEVIREGIAISHAALGVIFLTYVISNFIVMMAYNQPAHKVLYRPNRMPFFTYRLAGVIAILAFVFASGWRDYVSNTFAGFYNYAADLYIMQDNEAHGRALYQRSALYSFANHRANYALGMIKANRLDFRGADENFEYACWLRPSDFSLVNRGNLFLWRKMYFPAIELYRSAHATQPSAPLHNNLAYAFSRIHNLDSALYYMNLARESELTRTAAETNFFATAASELLPINADSILRTFDSEIPAVLANAMAVSALFGQPSEYVVDPLRYTELDIQTAILLNNYLVAHAKAVDTAFVNNAYRIANDSLNRPFADMLKAGTAHAYYHLGNVYRAQEIMAELAFLSHEYRGMYNYTLGLWALEQGSPNVAEVHFNYAGQANFKDAKLYRAIALTEARRIDEALVAWDTLGRSGTEDQKQLARHIRQLLTTDVSRVSSLADPEKYQFTRYRLGPKDTLVFSQIVNTFTNPNYRVLALVEMAKKLQRAGDPVGAVRYYNQTTGIQVTDAALYNQIENYRLMLLASNNDLTGLVHHIDEFGDRLRTSDYLEGLLYNALIDVARGDTTQARERFHILATWNPFFEEGILAAANFYREIEPDGFTAYEVLARAIQVNTHSRRLLAEYVKEAQKKGFAEYANEARERLAQLP